MDPKLRFIAVAGSVFVFVFVIELVRRRRLKEEYSLLWILTSAGLIVLAAWDGLLNEASNLIGAAAPQSTLFFFGLTFVVLMLLHFSIRISALERQIISLVQEIGLLSVPLSQREGNGEKALDSGIPLEAREHVGAGTLAETPAKPSVRE
jgi:hypothetical protein